MAAPEYDGLAAVRVLFEVLGKIPTRIILYVGIGSVGVIGSQYVVRGAKATAAEFGIEIVTKPSSEMVLSTFAANVTLILLGILGLGVLVICLGVVFALLLRLAIDRLQRTANARDSREIHRDLELALAEEELSERTQARLLAISARRLRRHGFWARLWFGSR